MTADRARARRGRELWQSEKSAVMHGFWVEETGADVDAAVVIGFLGSGRRGFESEQGRLAVEIELIAGTVAWVV